MASIEIVCYVRFCKENVKKLPADLQQSYSFPAHTNPVLFDLWARCPTVMLALPGETRPLTNMDASLMGLPSPVLVALDWTPEHRELHLRCKMRLCAMVRATIDRQMCEMRIDYLRLATRDRRMVAYMEQLERGELSELPLFDD